MNEIRKNWDFVFPIIAVVVAIIATICNFTYGLDTLYDEGCHCLDMLSSITDGAIPGDDRTWWSDIFLTLFGCNICSSVVSLRVVKLCVAILTSLLFWLLTWDVAKTKGEKIGYLSVIMLFSILTMGGIMVCYNSMSQFLFVISCGVLYRMNKTENDTHRILFALLLGCLLTFSLFAIIVSGVVVSAAMLFLIVYRYWKSWKQMFSVLGAMTGGLVVTLLWVHIFAIPLQQVWDNIMDIGQAITKVGRGYDPISMGVQMMLFLRDLTLCVITLIGINYLSEKVRYHSVRWIAGLCYVSLFLVYAHYQTKPQVTASMLLCVLWVQALWAKYNEKAERIVWKHIFRYEHVFNIFLMAFPMLAVLGTVVYIGLKMTWFIIPWVFLAWRLGFAEKRNIMRAETLIAISLLMLVPSVKTLRSIDPSQDVIQCGALKGMHLTPEQAAHFEKVDSIVAEYDFKKNESVFFTTQLSMATVCYLEAIPCGFYFEIMSFLAHADANTPKPDFIFMNDYDHTIGAEYMHQIGWGWPDEFDKYYIGTPETATGLGYSTERWLYCRTRLQKNAK